MPVFEVLITAVTTILGSTGIWSYLQATRNKNAHQAMLLKGLAYSAIISESRYYLNRGDITTNEFADLYNTLFVPYKQMGGNGSAERIIKEVEKLPIVHNERDIR